MNLRKKILCDWLGWHNGKPDFNKSAILGQGFQMYGVCKKCGKLVMLDSQGNWY